jgi:hypothetical protein
MVAKIAQAHSFFFPLCSLTNEQAKDPKSETPATTKAPQSKAPPRGSKFEQNNGLHLIQAETSNNRSLKRSR